MELQNKLNPLSIALSILSSKSSDEFIQVTQTAGVSIDLGLTTAEDYSNKTRVRKYLIRVKAFIENLENKNALIVIHLIFKELLKNGNDQLEVKKKLNAIGWDILDDSIVPIESDVIELYFEKGLIHSAYVKIREIVHGATKEVCIVDPYIDSSIFELFKIFTNKNIRIKILTFKSHADYDHEKALFSKEYPNVHIEEKLCKDFHDRFLIIDNSDVFHIGASIKDAGRKVFMINKIEDKAVSSEVIKSFKDRWI